MYSLDEVKAVDPEVAAAITEEMAREKGYRDLKEIVKAEQPY